jgi:RNA polymerase sigma-70 factor (ECF subfamily)
LTDSEFEATFELHKDAVYRFAWRMTNSPEVAEDITQEVFLALLRQPARFDATRGELRPFLFGIARNLVLKKVRQEKNRWSELDQEQFVAQPVDPAGCEIAEIVARAVRDLPPLQREVLVLAEYEGLSLDEIAQTVDAEVGTVKSRLYRARENLRRMLARLKGVVASPRSYGTTH